MPVAKQIEPGQTRRCAVNSSVDFRRLAVIEVGSRAIRLLVGDVGQGRFRVVATDNKALDLMGMAASRLPSAGIGRLERLIDRYRLKAVESGAQAVRVIGTEAIRQLADRSAVPRRLDIEILSTDDEARLSFLGAAGGLGSLGAQNELLVIDQGAGSLEVVDGWLRPKPEVRRSASFKLGVTCVASIYNNRGQCMNALRQHVSQSICGKWPKRQDPLIRCATIAGGTATRLGWLAVRNDNFEKYHRSRVHGATFDLECLRRILNRLQMSDETEIRRFTRDLMPAARSSEAWCQFLAGATVLCEVASLVGANELRVSTTGTRLGALIDMASPF